MAKKLKIYPQFLQILWHAKKPIPVSSVPQFLTFGPKHSQDLLWFSHSADVFKNMFLLQTYVQVSEDNFFWIHLIDFSLKSKE